MKFNIFLIPLIFIALALYFSSCNITQTKKDLATEPTEEIATEISKENIEENTENTTTLLEKSTNTDKFECYQVVDNTLSELVNSKEFINATYDKKEQLALSTLKNLEDEGFIIKNSIFYNENNVDLISFKYKNGASGGLKLRPFSSDIN